MTRRSALLASFVGTAGALWSPAASTRASEARVELGVVEGRTDPTYAGLGASSWGASSVDPVQAQAERSLDVRSFRVGVRWDGSRIVSRVGQDVEPVLRELYSRPGVKLSLIAGQGRYQDWSDYRQGDVAAIGVRLRSIGLSDMARLDFTGPNEPDLAGARDMDEVAGRAVQIVDELRSVGISKKVWGPVWSSPGADFGRFADALGPERLAGIVWHSYPGGAGVHERSVRTVLNDVVRHHEVVRRTREMLDAKGLWSAGVAIDEFNWSWQHGRSPTLFTTANTVLFALAYCEILSAGGRVAAFTSQNGDLGVMSDGLVDTRTGSRVLPSSPMPAYWGIGALTGAGRPGQGRLFPHYSDTFYRVSRQSDPQVRTFAVSDEGGGVTLVVINCDERQSRQHRIAGLRVGRHDVFQTRSDSPYSPPARLASSTRHTDGVMLHLPALSVTMVTLS